VVLDTEPHGEVISHKLRRFCSASGVGFECADLQDDTLIRGPTIPYSATPSDSERAWTARLSGDQRFIFSNIEQYPPGEEASWTDTQNDAYIADVASGKSIRTPLGLGWITTKSYAVASPHVALYALTHPDGDTAFLLDANSSSSTFGQILAILPLDPLQNNPNTPERSPFDPGFQTRNAALSPDGQWGFVTHGGDGLISVIDIRERKIVRTLEVPSPLGDLEASFSGGGRLIAVQAGKRSGDTIGR
jgi:hypothetical protein